MGKSCGTDEEQNDKQTFSNNGAKGGKICQMEKTTRFQWRQVVESGQTVSMHFNHIISSLAQGNQSFAQIMILLHLIRCMYQSIFVGFAKLIMRFK
ncbi:hypothetical protein Bhyg_13474, partial [Pseudolycoriella hygida]